MSLKSYKAYSDSEYLRKEDFPEPETLTIAEVREEEVQAPGKEPKLKVILYFEERQKGLVLNLANGAVLELITKSDLPDKWVGTRVRVYHDPNVEFGGKKVGGIRIAPVRKPVPPGQGESVKRPVFRAAGKSPAKSVLRSSLDDDDERRRQRQEMPAEDDLAYDPNVEYGGKKVGGLRPRKSLDAANAELAEADAEDTDGDGVPY